jgi:hypothetical protein
MAGVAGIVQNMAGVDENQSKNGKGWRESSKKWQGSARPFKRWQGLARIVKKMVRTNQKMAGVGETI